MAPRSIEDIKARADEFADAFENYDPKPGGQDAPIPPVMAVKLAAWRRDSAERELGWIAVTVGMVLFIVSFARMVRANPGTRIPYFRNPEVNPSGTIAMRSIGVGVLVIGAAALAPTLGYWVAPILFALPSVIPATIAVHNRRLMVAA